MRHTTRVGWEQIHQNIGRRKDIERFKTELAAVAVVVQKTPLSRPVRAQPLRDFFGPLREAELVHTCKRLSCHKNGLFRAAVKQSLKLVSFSIVD